MNLSMIGQASSALLSGLNARDAKIEADKDKALQQSRQAIADNRATEQYNHDLARQPIEDARKDTEYEQGQQVKQIQLDDMTRKDANTKAFINQTSLVGSNNLVGRDQNYADTFNGQATNHGMKVIPSGKGDGVFTYANADGSPVLGEDGNPQTNTYDSDAQTKNMYSLIDPTKSYETQASSAAEIAKENRKNANDLKIAQAGMDKALAVAKITGGYRNQAAQTYADSRDYAADRRYDGQSYAADSRSNTPTRYNQPKYDLFGNRTNGGGSTSPRPPTRVSIPPVGNQQGVEINIEGMTPDEVRKSITTLPTQDMQDRALKAYEQQLQGVGTVTSGAVQQQKPQWKIDDNVDTDIRQDIQDGSPDKKTQIAATGYYGSLRKNLSSIGTGTPQARSMAINGAYNSARAMALTLNPKLTGDPQQLNLETQAILTKATGYEDWSVVAKQAQADLEASQTASGGKGEVVDKPLAISPKPTTKAPVVDPQVDAAANQFLTQDVYGTTPTKGGTVNKPLTSGK
jgi:hypothetical protein